MATTTQPYLEITDGTTSVKLMDSSATNPTLIAAMTYRLSFGGWSPRIAQRNKSPFGLPYLPVTEDLLIDVRGSTAAIALANLQTLNTLLDQGERWFNNEKVNPVFIRYQPKGSERSTYMQDVIIGRGLGDRTDGNLVNPDDFNFVGDSYWIKGVRVQFQRRNGFWLCESETPSIVSGVAQPGPIAFSYTDVAKLLSPVDVQIWNSNSSSTDCSGFIIITHDDRYIGVVEGADGVTTYYVLGTTSTADAGKLPTNAFVGRLTATTTQSFVYISPIQTPINECEYCAIYATVRNNDATDDVYLQISLNNEISLGNNPVSLQEVRIAANTNPQAVFLGIFPTRGRLPSGIYINHRTLSGTATLDIDTVLIVGVNRATTIIATKFSPGSTTSQSAGVGLFHRLFNEPQNEVCVGTPPTSDRLLSYTGAAHVFTGGHLTIKETAIALLFTDGTKWRIADVAGTSPVTLSAEVTRRKAYLTPE